VSTYLVSLLAVVGGARRGFRRASWRRRLWFVAALLLQHIPDGGERDAHRVHLLLVLVMAARQAELYFK
jgi:hypothetical protein